VSQLNGVNGEYTNSDDVKIERNYNIHKKSKDHKQVEDKVYSDEMMNKLFSNLGKNYYEYLECEQTKNGLDIFRKAKKMLNRLNPAFDQEKLFAINACFAKICIAFGTPESRKNYDLSLKPIIVDKDADTEEEHIVKYQYISQTLSEYTLILNVKMRFVDTLDGDFLEAPVSILVEDGSFIYGPNKIILLDYFTFPVDFSYFSYKVPRSTVIYSPFIYDKFNEHLGILLPDGDKNGRNYRVAHGYMMKHFPSVPFELRKNTLDVVCFHYYRMGVSGVGDFPLPSYDVLKYYSFSYGGPSDIEGSLNEFVNNWDFNKRWKLKLTNAYFSTNPADRSKILIYPSFKTQEEKIKFRVYRYCQFQPSIQFQYYDVSPQNITSALSRLMKAREDEHTLFRNQLRFLRIADTSILKECDATITSEVEKEKRVLKLNTRFNKSYKIPQFDKDSYYDKFFNKLCDQFNVESRHQKMMRLLKEGFQFIIEDILKKTNVLIIVPFLIILVAYHPFYYLLDRFEWMDKVVELPSPKKLLYMLWYYKEDFHKVYNNPKLRWNLKIKKEAGKFKKAARLYASGEDMCLVDRILPDFAKHVFSKNIVLCSPDEYPDEFVLDSLSFDHTHRYYGYTFECKFANAQSANDSDELFQYLSKLPSKTIAFIYFSDDSIIVESDHNSNKHIYEADISSCDASNCVAIFCLLYTFLSKVSPQQAAMLISQASNSATCVNPHAKDESIDFQPETFNHYSGWAGTTIINNLASYLIACGVFHKLLTGSEIIDSVASGAKEVGYIVTVERSITVQGDFSFNCTSFLKRAYSTTSQRSWKVLGTLLRSFLIFETPITAEMLGVDIKFFKKLNDIEKFDRACVKRLESEKQEPVNPIYRVLCNRFNIIVKEDDDITLNDLIERYGGEIYQWENFMIQITELKIGDIIRDRILDLIFYKDYGVSLPI